MKRIRRQIIAIGGGGMSTAPRDQALDRYVLSQVGSANPYICFLPTATGDSDAYIARFYATVAHYRCRPSHIPLFARTPDLRRMLLTADVIYVGGGNTKSMLATWKDWDIPALLRRAWNSGIVLAGVSAGAICWFDTGITDSWADDLYGLPCLGFLRNTCCPHFDGEPERRPALHRLVGSGAVPRALALDDGVAAHFVGRRLERIVTSRPDATGYDVRRNGSKAVETALPAVSLVPRRQQKA
jgi:peptidase E